jgi:hypothetical protein
MMEVASSACFRPSGKASNAVFTGCPDWLKPEKQGGLGNMEPW